MADSMDTRASVEGLFTLAKERARAGDEAGAARTWDAAVALAEEAGLQEIVAVAEAGLAQADVRERRLDIAQARLESAWARCQGPGIPAGVRAQVGGQLGQVLVFQGRPADGVALMHAAVGDWRAAGDAAAAHELELAVSAVCERVDRAVDELGDGAPEARAAALSRRAQVALATGHVDRATADLEAAWGLAQGLPARPRGRVAALYGQLLTAQGAPGAMPILQAARAAWQEAADPAWVARVDALISRASSAAEA
jgi:hypothetical protein